MKTWNFASKLPISSPSIQICMISLSKRIVRIVQENCTKRRFFALFAFLHAFYLRCYVGSLLRWNAIQRAHGKIFFSYLVKDNVLWKSYLRKNEAKIMYAAFYFTYNTYKVKAGWHSCTDKVKFFLVRWPEISADFCTSRMHVQDLSTSEQNTNFKTLETNSPIKRELPDRGKVLYWVLQCMPMIIVTNICSIIINQWAT